MFTLRDPFSADAEIVTRPLGGVNLIALWIRLDIAWRKRVASLVVDPEDVSETHEDDDGAEVALRRTAVRSALAELSARDREIIALKFHAGLRNTELARVLGVSETAAGTLLYRAMEKLRKACDART